MALLQAYEEEYAELNTAVQKDLQTLRQSINDTTGVGSTEQRNKLLLSIQGNLSKMREVYGSMDVEANNLAPAKKDEAKQKIAEYKRAVFGYEKDCVKAKQDITKKEKDELLAATKKREDSVEMNDTSAKDVAEANARMTKNTENMKKGNEILKDAERLVNQTDAIADDVIDELGKQREKIIKIQQTTHEADEEANQARRILTRMNKVMIQNKAILIVIICVLLFMIFLIVYLKFSGSSSDTTVVVVTQIPLPPPPTNCVICISSGSNYR
jgi:hypothetical protein